jgi:hypothetical protein
VPVREEAGVTFDDDARDDAPLQPTHGPAQPSHAEILANLERMRRRRVDTPRDARSFEQVAAAVLKAQEALPIQHCPTCPATYRRHVGGTCHPCTVARRRG